MDRRKRGETGETEPAPGGFRWKTLYLPEGTRLQVGGRSDAGFAYVVDGQLIWRGGAPRRTGLPAWRWAIHATRGVTKAHAAYLSQTVA
jgi:hypothetical protein